MAWKKKGEGRKIKNKSYRAGQNVINQKLLSKLITRSILFLLRELRFLPQGLKVRTYFSDFFQSKWVLFGVRFVITLMSFLSFLLLLSLLLFLLSFCSPFFYQFCYYYVALLCFYDSVVLFLLVLLLFYCPLSRQFKNFPMNSIMLLKDLYQRYEFIGFSQLSVMLCLNVLPFLSVILCYIT